MNKTLVIFVLGLSIALVTSIKVRSEQVSPSSSSSSGTEDSAATVSSLLLASTAVERIEILDQDTDWVFNFLNPTPNTTVESGKGGRSILANRKNFPAVVGNGMAMSIGFIGPCGLNTPHIHPRATEMNYAVNGTLATGFIGENGARQVLNEATPGTVSIFPRGSIHWEANLGCDTVIFVAAFNDEDPGVSQIAQNFYEIDEGILSATLGGTDANSLNKTASKIPANIALGLQTCLTKCGLTQTNNQKNDGTSTSSSPSYSSSSTPSSSSSGY